MSTPPPPRRRRIAGESKPGAAPPAAKKRPAKPARPSRPPVAPPAAAKSPSAATDKPATKARARKVEASPPPAPARPAVPSAPDETAQPDVATRRFSWRMTALAALTLGALAFGVIFGVRGVMEWRGGGVAEAHDQAATTAATAGETIFTYQYNDLDGHLSEAKEMMTASFAKKFESVAPALRDLAPQRKIQVKATVRNAATEECGSSCRADRAKVLVFIDQARVADGSKEPTVFGNRIELSMVEQDGRWLVDDIKAL